MNLEQVIFRSATRQDLRQIINMLADDKLGALREDASEPINQAYLDAVESIRHDPNNMLIVAVLKDQVMGIVQLTFIPNLSYIGRWRVQIEGVRIHKKHRSLGIGQQIIEHAIKLSKTKNCHMVQLTANKSRTKSIDFYQQLGFVASHEGFKYMLTAED